MEDREVLERWRQVVAELDAETAEQFDWGEEPPGHLLHVFRPDGERLSELLVGFDGGQAITQRLLEIFDVAGHETGHAYFIPSKFRPLSEAQVQQLIRDYLRNVSALADLHAHEGADVETAALASGKVAVSIGVGTTPDRKPSDVNPLESLVYEIVTECGDAPFGGEQLALLLREPLYMIACSYQLAFWVLWPLADQDEAVSDPFSPYFRLWAAGMDLHFDGDASGGYRVVAYPHNI